MRIYVEGIGVRGDGLDGWTDAAAVLTGARDYVPAPAVLPPSPLLPPNERRRTVPTVKLALAVGAEAFGHAGREPAETATIFTSSGGDGETIHRILEALAEEEIEVSPTRFHNSVHNAPSGYWSIATRSLEPTTSLCAHDASFTAGLLEAAAQATLDGRPVGLMAYDLPYPGPLDEFRTIGSTFGVGLIASPAPSPAAFASLEVALVRGNEPPTMMAEPALETVRLGNPAARSLPLLQALARGIEARIVLEYLGDATVTVAVAPLAAPGR